MSDWLFVRDHCEAIGLVLARGQVGRTYNVGGLCERANVEVVDQICDLLDEMTPRSDGSSHRTLKCFLRDRPGHDRRYAIDCRRIQSELGWQPKESFESGLRQTVAWYLEHREWCAAITAGTYQRGRLGTAAAAR